MEPTDVGLTEDKEGGNAGKREAYYTNVYKPSYAKIRQDAVSTIPMLDKADNKNKISWWNSIGQTFLWCNDSTESTKLFW